MSSFNAAPSYEQNKNGQFLTNIEPQAAQASLLGRAVAEVSAAYIENGDLADALSHMRDQNITVVSDYWDNSALDVLAVESKITGFDDTTSNGKTITAASYLVPKSPKIDTAENPLNADDRFPDHRPKGFEVTPKEEQPNMAIVALDPSRLDATGIDANDKAALLEELIEIKDAVMKRGETERELSPHLTDVLSICLLKNDTFTRTQDADGNETEWALPYDKIASIKALYTLLSGKDKSAALRQGAIRVEGNDGQELIVGCSGLNSAIDEMVARNFAADVFTQHNTPAKVAN